MISWFGRSILITKSECRSEILSARLDGTGTAGKGFGDGKDLVILLWAAGLSRVACRIPLRHRFCHRLSRAENNRHRRGYAGCRCTHYRPSATLAIRRAAQCDGQDDVQAIVDAIRSCRYRTKHVRASRQPCSDIAVLAVATYPRDDLARKQSHHRYSSPRTIAIWLGVPRRSQIEQVVRYFSRLHGTLLLF
jgi:hypothetical protein